MIGFVYLWYDRKRRMFCLGSHLGSENDGYITSTGYMKRAYRKRPYDFRRRILRRIYEGGNIEVRAAEQYYLNMIKVDELGVRYYNLKKIAIGGGGTVETGKWLASISKREDQVRGGRIGGLIGGKSVMAAKDPDGVSTQARKMGRIGGKVLGPHKIRGGKKGGAIVGKMMMEEKDERGKSVHAVRMALISNLGGSASRGGKAGGPASMREKNEEGKSVHAIKMGSIGGKISTHRFWHIRRGIVNPNCELCVG